jgi:hypothetical protein
MRRLRLALPALLAIACTEAPEAQRGTDAAATSDTDPQNEFWTSLLALCDGAYRGRAVEAPAGDTTFADRALVMHVRLCSDEEIRIAFHVGEDRSRTWVLTRDELGLGLRHDHRHEDGSADSVTGYGGETRTAGEPTWQEFPANQHTATLLPAAATNVWTIEVVPGELFVYALRREGTDRRYRIEFGLTQPVEAPPAPWGAGGG